MNNNYPKITKYILVLFFTMFFTILWVKAWNWLTASSWDKLDYQKWNELVWTIQSWVPSWAVMAFDLAACPTWWSAYSNWIWRTIIWVWNWAGSNTALDDLWGDKSSPAINIIPNLSFNWSAYIASSTTPGTKSNIPSNNSVLLQAWTTSMYGAPWTNNDLKIWPDWSIHWSIWWNITGWWTAPDNMQPYVALLYCKKN